MGFYHGSSEPPPEKEPGGCRDVLLLTRVVFGVLFWPMAVLLGAVLGLVLIFYLFSVYWGLGLLGIAVLIAGIVFYARWERAHITRQ